MKKFAFISRHEPAPEQIALASEKGIELVHVGDVDGFRVTPEWVKEQLPDVKGVCVVHAGAAMNLAEAFPVALFENGNRAEIGEKPQFVAKELHIFDISKPRF